MPLRGIMYTKLKKDAHNSDCRILEVVGGGGAITPKKNLNHFKSCKITPKPPQVEITSNSPKLPQITPRSPLNHPQAP